MLAQLQATLPRLGFDRSFAHSVGSLLPMADDAKGALVALTR